LTQFIVPSHMQSKGQLKSGKKSKKNDKFQKKLGTSLMLYKTFNPMKTKSSVLWTDTISIMSTLGTTPLLINGSNQYWNINQIWGSTDFNLLQTSYYYCRFNYAVFEIVRAVDEATMYAQTGGWSLFLNYYPHLQSSVQTFADVSRNQDAYRLDLMTFDKQSVVCNSVDLEYPQLVLGSYLLLNNKKFIDMAIFPLFSGQLSIADNNIIAATATRKLFSITWKVHVTFAYRK